MSVKNFIPQIWSAKILDSLDRNLVYGNLVNRNYEGEITFTNTDMDAPEELIGTQKTLTTDQQKYFELELDDVSKVQSNVKLIEEATEKFGRAMADVVDKHIASLYTDIPAKNQIGSDATPIVVDKTNAYDYLVDLSVILDDNDVDEMDRWVVVPNWYHGLLLKVRDDRFTRDVDKVMRNGYIGEVAGMSIYSSNNVPNVAGAKYKVIAGTNDSISMATQLVKMEAQRMENKFADLVRGLNVYGVKNLRPEGMALLTCNE